MKWNAVIQELNSDEPDYEALASGISASGVHKLVELVREGEPMMASKVTHLASLVTAPGAIDVIGIAADRPEAIVRVAAAAALARLDTAVWDTEADSFRETATSETLDKLLQDPDPGVRKFATRSAESLGARSVSA